MANRESRRKFARPKLEYDSISKGTIITMIISIFWLFPLILIFINSFKSDSEILNHFLELPKKLDFTYFIETWTKYNFPKLVGNTLLYTVCTVLIVVLLAPLAAYYLERHKNERRCRIAFGLIILPIMVPFQSYMISLTRILGKLGLNNTRIGYILISAGLCMPLAVFMIHGYINTIPKELEESAYIDGAGKVRTYFSIVLPLLVPILTTVVVLDALATWNDVITNQLVVGSNEMAINMQNALYMKFSAQTSDWSHALPGTVMSMLPSLIFFIFMQKYIISGTTSGSVKG